MSSQAGQAATRTTSSKQECDKLLLETLAEFAGRAWTLRWYGGFRYHNLLAHPRAAFVQQRLPGSHLAVLLAPRAEGRSWTSLVELHPARGKPTLFFVHGIGRS